jgi:hypothetical protein
MELKLLTDEEILAVIKSQRDKFDVDEFVLINVETIKPFIQAQLDQDKAELEAIEDKIYETVENNYVENIIPKMIGQAKKEVINWLDEPCTEEHYHSVADGKMHTWIDSRKRKDCKYCWNELKQKYLGGE